MFDFDFGKLMIVGIVALAVIPPKDLPRVMRTVGQAVGKMRRMAAEFQGQFMDAMREADLENVRKELDALNQSALSEKAKVEADLDAVRHELNALNEKAKLDASLNPPGTTGDEATKAVEPLDIVTHEIALDGPQSAAPAAPVSTSTPAGPGLPAEEPAAKPSAAA
jgi:sec-independent protein translocase protein TatB